MTDGVWMTQAELAAARRISVGSANRLIRQRRWQRQPGEDGRTRVLVPRRWAEISIAIGGTRADPLAKASADGPPETVAALQAEVMRLRAALEMSQAACRKAELACDAERQARRAAELATEELRQQAEEASRTIAALRRARENHAAEERAEQVTREATAAQLRRLTEALAARRSLGRWARLRLAWRGQ